MIDSLGNFLDLALGLGAKQINFWQMGLRAAVVYVAALLMVRMVGDRRFIGKFAAIDVILSIIFGSTLSRAINGTSAFFESIFAGFILVAMHWLFSAVSFHHQGFEDKIKGRSRHLIKNGRLCRQTMKNCHITSDDLVSTLRVKCQIDELEKVESACLERNGDISFSLKEQY